MLKHALPMVAHFDWALAVTFGAPADALAPLLAPGLALDSYRGHAFLAVACVQARRLRPKGMPSFLGLDFFLVGYRLFVRFEAAGGRNYRGLQILGSETDRWPMVVGGRIFTHYAYRKVAVDLRREELALSVTTSRGLELQVRDEAPGAPEGSVFGGWEEARRYAGPMPFTFASEAGGRRIVRVEGVRTHWKPRPVGITRSRVPFLEALLGFEPSPAAAFLVEDVDYRWERGVREEARDRE